MLIISNKKTPWPKSVSELYRPSDCHLSVKLVPTFADAGCHVVGVTGSYGRILEFLDRSQNTNATRNIYNNRMDCNSYMNERIRRMRNSLVVQEVSDWTFWKVRPPPKKKKLPASWETEMLRHRRHAHTHTRTHTHTHTHTHKYKQTYTYAYIYIYIYITYLIISVPNLEL
jgi:hypothetical protein